ncbi:NEK protein kinase [Allomyces macrogynus ATCC 38327]|uniref:non-specific serine/threonine protein kinase n=1 Tax=Allomyces macrogynus (strain ATCC 38327) TaxID=578462 RepID=A0A0L0SVD5_ALLM3|nr:NEK protein kinase [Allomyces macrogynus ATCC 38327]|eukprot:KNE66533.1 NEK protein kinase [Allomyces macrogynus ATCC 38327]
MRLPRTLTAVPLHEYTARTCLGRGSYGRVDLLQREIRNSTTFPRKIVLKTISLDKSVRDGITDPQREPQLLSAVRHPNVVRLLDWAVDDARIVMITEYANAGDLSQYLQRRAAASRALSPTSIFAIFIQLCLGVSALHAHGILHRDIKAKNIFLHVVARSAVLVKLGDFGIAKPLASPWDATTTAIGTPYYLAPEICRGESYGLPADIWACGVVLFELCTLRRPFAAASLAPLMRQIVEDPFPAHRDDWITSPCIPPAVWSLVYRLLDKDPRRRPTAEQVLHMPVIVDFISRARAIIDTDTSLYQDVPRTAPPPEPPAAPKRCFRQPVAQPSPPSTPSTGDRSLQPPKRRHARGPPVPPASPPASPPLDPTPPLPTSVYHLLECTRAALERELGGPDRVAQLYAQCQRALARRRRGGGVTATWARIEAVARRDESVWTALALLVKFGVF